MISEDQLMPFVEAIEPVAGFKDPYEYAYYLLTDNLKNYGEDPQHVTKVEYASSEAESEYLMSIEYAPLIEAGVKSVNIRLQVNSPESIPILVSYSFDEKGGCSVSALNWQEGDELMDMGLLMGDMQAIANEAHHIKVEKLVPARSLSKLG